MKTNGFKVLDRDTLKQYLDALGVAICPPSVGALAELVFAQLTNVPFENISKLYYKKRIGLKTIPDIHTYLAGIEKYHFGGTCFSNNYHFFCLLLSLGYSARLCGADMNNPDAHMAIMVDVGDREFLVDVGYAAPFLSPLPRDLPIDYSIALGRDKYILKPQDAMGNTRLELYRDGILKHGYLAKPELKTIDNFSIAASFSEDATFMNALLLARFFPNRSIVIHNLTVVESHGTESKSYVLRDREELGQVVEDLFAIPKHIVTDAVGELRSLSDPWN